MAGTQEGGYKVRDKLITINPNHYKEMGAVGGRKGKVDGAIKGFAQDREQARSAGAKGGRASRREK